MGKYNEFKAAKALNKLSGIKVVTTNKTIIIDNKSYGNSTSAKIDFLVNYCGYKKIAGTVNDKTKKTVKTDEVEIPNSFDNKKLIKRDLKSSLKINGKLKK